MVIECKMLCKGSVQELNKRVSCWLPADRSSSFQLCRRCHFYRITEIMDSVTFHCTSDDTPHPNESFLLKRSFLQELFHPAREQALINLLFVLFEKRPKQYKNLVQDMKTFSEFSILISKKVEQHTPGTKCRMYRSYLSDSSVYKSQRLCWNCWDCISWILKKGDERLLTMYTQEFGFYFSKITPNVLHTVSPRIFLDMLVSLYLQNKEHHIRLLFDHFFHILPLDEVKSLALGFFQQPLMISLFLEGKATEYIPLPLREKVVLDDFRKQIFASIKRTTDIYKEELMIVTCHPDRLFSWCLDIEELKDFDF